MRIDPSAWLTFLRQGIAQWDQTASLLPSQRWLVDAMVDALAPERARCVVELGPGVGVMTKPLLARMRPDATLFTIELDPAIHDELVRSVRDPRLVAICGSAEHLTELLAERGCEGEVDAVMSSLGMSMLPPPIRDRIVDAVIDWRPTGCTSSSGTSTRGSSPSAPSGASCPSTIGPTSARASPRCARPPSPETSRPRGCTRAARRTSPTGATAMGAIASAAIATAARPERLASPRPSSGAGGAAG